MSRKKPISIDQQISDAAEYLTKGEFFVALELAGLAEWHLNEQAPDLQTEYYWQELKPILSAAEWQTNQAIEEMLPKEVA